MSKKMWEQNLDARFPEYFDGAYYEKEDTNLKDELKDFIAETLTQSRLQYQKELVERIEEMKLPGESDGISITDYRHNSILNNVLEILKDPK